MKISLLPFLFATKPPRKIFLAPFCGFGSERMCTLCVVWSHYEWNALKSACSVAFSKDFVGFSEEWNKAHRIMITFSFPIYFLWWYIYIFLPHIVFSFSLVMLCSCGRKLFCLKKFIHIFLFSHFLCAIHQKQRRNASFKREMEQRTLYFLQYL